jgi:hypothetical protein
VKVDGRWLLRETATALRRRDEIRELARKVLDATPASSCLST